jgi:hypothetical protein
VLRIRLVRLKHTYIHTHIYKYTSFINLSSETLLPPKLSADNVCLSEQRPTQATCPTVYFPIISMSRAKQDTTVATVLSPCFTSQVTVSHDTETTMTRANRSKAPAGVLETFRTRMRTVPGSNTSRING